ncbi:MAG: amidohydrolase family protein, partial [Desulfobacterales bacterium]|nr:amidohydrolase family protein [Desulfobacterales bacterium]
MDIKTSHFDYVIKKGLVLDGTGGNVRLVDIGITGDTITAMGQISEERGKHIVDASGAHICPGFIDTHSHSDMGILNHPAAENCIQQGITTVITGNCGFSAAPITGSAVKVLAENFGKIIAQNDVADFLEQLEKIRISTNLALLIGHENLRASAVGMTNQSLTSDGLEDIVKILEKGMEQGAFGVSLGLEYAPGIFAPSNELVSLGQVV